VPVQAAKRQSSLLTQGSNHDSLLIDPLGVGDDAVSGDPRQRYASTLEREVWGGPTVPNASERCTRFVWMRQTRRYRASLGDEDGGLPGVTTPNRMRHGVLIL
jgi:hypothetical protein